MGYVHPFDTAARPRQRRGVAELRAARGRRAGQARLPRGDGLQRPPHHVRGLVPPAQLRLPHPGGRGHRRLPELRLAARAGGPAAHVRGGGSPPRAAGLPGRGQARAHVRDQRAAAGALGRRPARPAARCGSPRRALPARARSPCARRCPSTTWRSSATGRSWPRWTCTGDRTRAEATVDLPAAGSGWYVLRAWADRPRLPVLDLYPFASTSPVYVQVAGHPADSRQDAAYFVRWVDRVIAAAVGPHGLEHRRRARGGARPARARPRGLRRPGPLTGQGRRLRYRMRRGFGFAAAAGRTARAPAPSAPPRGSSRRSTSAAAPPAACPSGRTAP